MNPADRPCALCALPVGAAPVILHLSGQTLQFCCEGCRGIWLMLHDIQDSPPAAPADQPARS